jgi:hypothetical protein
LLGVPAAYCLVDTANCETITTVPCLSIPVTVHSAFQPPQSQASAPKSPVSLPHSPASPPQSSASSQFVAASWPPFTAEVKVPSGFPAVALKDVQCGIRTLLQQLENYFPDVFNASLRFFPLLPMGSNIIWYNRAAYCLEDLLFRW